MKKILLSLLAILCLGMANAQERTVWSGSWELPTDWSSLKIDADDFGLLSENDVITIYYTTDGKWMQYKLMNASDWSSLNFGGNEMLKAGTAPLDNWKWSNESRKDAFSLTAEQAAIISANGIRIQGGYGDEGGSVTFTKVTITPYKIFETEGQSVTYDEWGNILAKDLKWYTSDTQLEFSYNIEGELTNSDGSIVGWGTGYIASFWNSTTESQVKAADLPAKVIGENKYSITMAGLSEALSFDSGKGGDWNYGIVFGLWTMGNITAVSRNYVKAYRPLTPIISPGDSKYFSYVTETDLDFEGTGLSAYVATAVNSSSVTISEVTKVPAGTAILLKDNGSTEYKVPQIANAEAVSSNLLQASTGAATGSNTYALNAEGEFAPVEGSVVIPEGKVYLQTSSGAKVLDIIVEDDNATAIKDVTNDKIASVQKKIQNGRIVIVNGDKAYSVTGTLLK